MAWVTMGMRHIPHSEDLPVVHTDGNDVSFYLLPFNHFPENPAMGSRDFVRYSLGEMETQVEITRNSKTDAVECVPERNRFDEHLKNNPSKLFSDSKRP